MLAAKQKLSRFRVSTLILAGISAVSVWLAAAFVDAATTPLSIVPLAQAAALGHH